MNAPPTFEPGLRNPSPVQQWLLALSVSLLTALAVVSPFFFLGTASGHDVEFHMASWLDVAGQWKQGIVFPRWAEWANYGFGEPRFIFYPPLSWLLGAFLGSLIPWHAVAAVFIVCVQTFAGLSAYALLRSLCQSGWAAQFGAASFAANPYALVIIYTRSDFAELLAIAFFPLLLLFALKLCGLLRPGENVVPGLSPASSPLTGGFHEVFAFGLTFCGIWLSNAPAGIIATYTAAFLFVLGSLVQRSKAPVLYGAAAMLLGFCFAAFYMIPAIYEQRWIHIFGALAGGLAPNDNFLYARTADAEHDAFNHVASNVAVLLLAWAALAAVTAWRRRQAGNSSTQAISGQGAHLTFVPPLTVLSASVLVLMLPLTSLLWRFLPELRFVQFPWRWMSVLALCAIAFTTVSTSGKLKWIWPLAAVLAIGSSGRYLVKHTWWDTEDMPTLQAALQDSSGFEGTDEYDPAGDDHTDLAQKQPRAKFLPESREPATRAGQEIFIDTWKAERRSLRVISPAPARVALRLLNYPAWQVQVNGHRIAAQHPDGTEQMIVPVVAGESRIQIEFTRTADRTIGGWLSVLSFLGCSGTLLWQSVSKSRL